MTTSEDGGRRLKGLEMGTVRVRWFALDEATPADLARWRATLDDGECARADRFVFESDRDTFIAAHALTRTMLSAVVEQPQPSWRFAPGPRGKPEIVPALASAGLRFNLSHTRAFVACALALHDDLGIDLETLDRGRPPDLDVADCFFAPAEVTVVHGAPGDTAFDVFLRFWTLKEAFIKATGEGLARALDSFAFDLGPLAIRFNPPDADDPTAWQFAQLRPTPQHLLAIALRCPASRLMRLDARAACPHEI